MKKQRILFILSLIFIISTVLIIVIFSDRDEKKQAAKSTEVENLSETESLNTSQLSPNSTLIRKSSAAGEFYPKDPAQLKSELESYLADAKKIDEQGKPRILVVPHAGLTYSGRTAAKGFKQIEGLDYKKVIILGVNHSDPKEYAAVFPYGEWETPLGNVEIDQDLASRIVNGNDIIFNTQEHQSDHSIEMEVLFLKQVLDNFEIVPIALGKPKNETVDALAYKISAVFDDQTLLIISTDLSHYPNYEDANRADFKTISGILSGRKRNFEQAASYNNAKNIPNLSTSACGYHAVRVGLKVNEILEFGTFTQIDYLNSGDITGDKDRVVGYAAVGVWKENLPSMEVSTAAKSELLILARDTLKSYYENKTRMLYEPENEILNKPVGAFVTLTKNDNLRGCVGNFDPDAPLYQVVQEMAINAAINDRRFTPVTKDELSEIEIEISTLTPLKPVDSWQDITLGKHGVKIVLNGKSGTLLPQVAEENKTDLNTFLTTICTEKAGLEPQCFQNPEAQIFTFEAYVFSEEISL